MNFSPHLQATWIDPNSAKTVSHSALMNRLANQRVVLLGETHDRYDIHRWQLHVATGLRAHRDNIALGFEMFPRRVQPILDEWTNGGLDQDTFLKKVEWETVWGFEPELYLPLFHFCREFRVPMYALNCRRELVTEVGKKGWDAIAIEDRDGLTPSKPATQAYRQYLADLVGGADLKANADKLSDALISDRFLRAQQTWDRAFACNIAQVLAEPNPPLMIGIIGRGHLEYGHGTPYQLNDLGIDRVSVLLPNDEPEINLIAQNGIAEALFGLTPIPAGP